MKILALLLSVLSLIASPAVKGAQTSQDPPDVLILKFNWNKELVGWERDPFSSPVESYDDMRRKAASENRRDPGRKTVDADTKIKSREKPPSRHAFRYKLLVKNNGTKTITAIDWDYIFFDAATNEVVGHHMFRSEQKIEPGKSKQLDIVTPEAPTKLVNASAVNEKKQSPFESRVLIKRIEYSDGSAWQESK